MNKQESTYLDMNNYRYAILQLTEPICSWIYLYATNRT